MKKGVLILLGMFMMVSTVEAKNGNELPNRFGFNYSYNDAVNFEERGIEFFIFTNGEFDFNTDNNIYYNQYGNRAIRNRAIHISRDYRGRINRIGNSFVGYDRFGNVTRIGNVFMRYNRGLLTDVGNLRVRYDNWGNPTFFGNVRNNFYNHNGFRINLNIGDVCNYNDPYFYRNDFRVNYSRIREDNNYYYYRANANARIGNRSKTLRRRKQASVITNRRAISSKRKSNNSYRRPATKNPNRKAINGRSIKNAKRNFGAVNSTKRNRMLRENSNTATRKTSSARTTRSTTLRKKMKNLTRKPASVRTNRGATPRKSSTNTTTIRRPASVIKRNTTPVRNAKKVTKERVSQQRATTKSNTTRSRRS